MTTLTRTEQGAENLRLMERKCELCARSLELSDKRMICEIGKRWPQWGRCRQFMEAK